MIGTRFPDNVIVLDRDGTIVVDRGYASDPNQLEFLPGSAEALRCLCEFGYRLVVITNQSGVGRGLMQMDDVEAMNARLHVMVKGIGAKLTKIYVCPHAPDDNCDCRKPRLALMEQAAAELNFDPRQSIVVGDKSSDVEFAHRAGARAIQIEARISLSSPAHLTVSTLLEAARSITRNTP